MSELKNDSIFIAGDFNGHYLSRYNKKINRGAFKVVETFKQNNMGTFLDRLETEKQELDEKLGKLEDFIDSVNFAKIDEDQRELLKIQRCAMATYSQVLFVRLAHIKAKGE